MRPVFVTFCTLFVPAVVMAQQPALGQVTGAFFAQSVASVETQIAFYRDKLGFVVVKQGEALNGGIRFALLKQGESVIELIQHKDARPRAVVAPTVTQDVQIHGFFKAGFAVEKIDSVYALLKARGVPIAYDLDKLPDFPGRSFTIRDPEGRLVQFFGP